MNLERDLQGNLEQPDSKSFLNFGKESPQEKDFGRENFGKESPQKKDFGRENFGKESPQEKDFGRENFGRENKRDFIKNIFSKKKLLICLILVFVLAGAGFFYYWFFWETPPEKWDEAEYSPASDYEVKETAQGLMVENKKAGLSFKVPDGWRVETERYRDRVALFSPDAQGSSIMEKGCKIVVEARYIKTGVQTIEQVLRQGHQAWGGVDEYELIKIKGKEALKNIADAAAIEQLVISIHLPIKRVFGAVVYSLGLSSKAKESESCFPTFDEFLNTVSIK